MRRLIYVLRFVRPAGTVPTGERTVASSVSITTAITPEGVTGKLKKLSEFQTAVMQNKAVVNKDGKTFTESGTITFGDPAGGNKIHFSSIGVGYIDVYPCPEKPYTAGTVMWKVDKGEGFFKGATGAITSNFLVDLTKPEDEGELIDHHFGVIYLP
jgi:hypothetical protein